MKNMQKSQKKKGRKTMSNKDAIKWLSILFDDCTHADWTDDKNHNADKAQALAIAILKLEGSADNG